MVSLFHTCVTHVDDMAPSARNDERPHSADGCQALQTLSMYSPNKRPSPITMATSPPVTHATMKTGQALTPPLTPRIPLRRRASSADVLPLSSIGLDEAAHRKFHIMEDSEDYEEADTVGGREFSWEETRPRPPTRKYQLIGSSSSGYEAYGRGVWSVVYRAVKVSDPEILSTSLLTPPTSPISHSAPTTHVNNILAIKVPSRRDAHKILDSEARILTYLHAYPQASNYLVPFHGYDEPAHRILMDPVPLSLDSHVKAAAKTARANFSTATMFDPVIGTSQWGHLATSLIAGLEFLHSRSCIHSDIKPANILLRPSSDPYTPGTYTPLYVDFSSSAIASSGTSPEQVSALTPDYASPELLTALKSGTAFTTPASDVFALAVTLLAAVIGESPYAAARMEVTKLGMCREGKPLDFARGGDQGSRVLQNSEASKVLEGAVRDPETRWSVKEWKEEARQVLKDWMSTCTDESRDLASRRLAVSRPGNTGP